MIDLTNKFEESYTFKNDKSFSHERWVNSFSNFPIITSLIFLWNEEEDNWLKLGSQEKLQIMAARHIPLLFVANKTFVNKLEEFYSGNFTFVIIDDPDSRIYSIDERIVSKEFLWRSDEVKADKFSINDLFYATH